MKTTKEIQLAALTFLRAFQENKAHELEGTFIAYNPILLYRQHQLYLAGSVIFSLLFFYLAYNAWYVDAVYYWHIDGPVIIGVTVIALFFVIAAILTLKYFELNKVIKNYLENPNQSIYGVLITKDYYFENSPSNFHIIPKDNIIRIDYEEEREDGELYIEVLLDLENHIEVRGINYNEAEFDIKNWVHQN